MKKIIIFSILCLISILPVFAEINQNQIRKEIKTYLDDIYGSTIIYIGHTTDSLSIPEKRLPNAPKPFSAGRYKVVFWKNNNKKALIFQTEAKVGHISPIIPGKTDVGGYVEIMENPESDYNTSTATPDKTESLEKLKLNDAELEYLIEILYKNFDKLLTETELDNFNQVKDFVLAIYFSNKNGILEYHNNLIKKLLTN